MPERESEQKPLPAVWRVPDKLWEKIGWRAALGRDHLRCAAVASSTGYRRNSPTARPRIEPYHWEERTSSAEVR
jgi:hypothetical protein